MGIRRGERAPGATCSTVAARALAFAGLFAVGLAFSIPLPEAPEPGAGGGAGMDPAEQRKMIGMQFKELLFMQPPDIGTAMRMCNDGVLPTGIRTLRLGPPPGHHGQGQGQLGQEEQPVPADPVMWMQNPDMKERYEQQQARIKQKEEQRWQQQQIASQPQSVRLDLLLIQMLSHRPEAINLISCLVDRGVIPVQSLPDQGGALLWHASARKHPKLVVSLLQRGASMWKREPFSMPTVLHAAISDDRILYDSFVNILKVHTREIPSFAVDELEADNFNSNAGSSGSGSGGDNGNDGSEVGAAASSSPTKSKSRNSGGSSVSAAAARNRVKAAARRKLVELNAKDPLVTYARRMASMVETMARQLPADAALRLRESLRLLLADSTTVRLDHAPVDTSGDAGGTSNAAGGEQITAIYPRSTPSLSEESDGNGSSGTNSSAPSTASSLVKSALKSGSKSSSKKGKNGKSKRATLTEEAALVDTVYIRHAQQLGFAIPTLTLKLLLDHLSLAVTASATAAGVAVAEVAVGADGEQAPQNQQQQEIIGNPEAMNLALDTASELQRLLSSTDIFGRTPLHFAAIRGNADVVTMLIDALNVTIGVLHHSQPQIAAVEADTGSSSSGTHNSSNSETGSVSIRDYVLLRDINGHTAIDLACIFKYSHESDSGNAGVAGEDGNGSAGNNASHAATRSNSNIAAYLATAAGLGQVEAMQACAELTSFPSWLQQLGPSSPSAPPLPVTGADATERTDENGAASDSDVRYGGGWDAASPPPSASAVRALDIAELTLQGKLPQQASTARRVDAVRAGVDAASNRQQGARPLYSCDADVVTPEQLTSERFYSRYLSLNRPLIIRGLALSWRQRSEWAKEALLERYGNVTLKVDNVIPYSENYGIKGESYGMSLREYVESMFASGVGGGAGGSAAAGISPSSSSSAEAMPYVFNYVPAAGMSERGLAAKTSRGGSSGSGEGEDVDANSVQAIVASVIPYPPFLNHSIKTYAIAADGEMERERRRSKTSSGSGSSRATTVSSGGEDDDADATDSSERSEASTAAPAAAAADSMGQPTDTHPLIPTWAQPKLQFYVGNAGTGAPVHIHEDAWNALIYGRKVRFMHAFVCVCGVCTRYRRPCMPIVTSSSSLDSTRVRHIVDDRCISAVAPVAITITSTALTTPLQSLIIDHHASAGLVPAPDISRHLLNDSHSAMGSRAVRFR